MHLTIPLVKDDLDHSTNCFLSAQNQPASGSFIKIGGDMVHSFLSVLAPVHEAIPADRFGNLAAVFKLPVYGGHIPGIPGLLWILAGSLLVIAGFHFSRKKTYWIYFEIAALIISEGLILGTWNYPAAGSLVNLGILSVSLLGLGALSFENEFEKEIRETFQQNLVADEVIPVGNDPETLPEPVKPYLRYTHSIDQPAINHFKVKLRGQIRKDGLSPWMDFHSRQYNFLFPPVRLFFMKAFKNKLPVTGFHRYRNGEASMDIRLLSNFSVQKQSGREMEISETVTFFNDMCCLAPATLTDKRINWLKIYKDKVKAEFTNSGITIAAWLYFNELGELINFISEDRYAATPGKGMRKLRWSTPLGNYRDFGGVRLAGTAETIYRYPVGDFCYGKFRIENVEYNIPGK